MIRLFIREKEDISNMDMEQVKLPKHYADGRKIIPWDAIHDWGLNFNLGSAVKYIARAGRKDDILQDLYKAKEYLEKEISCIEADRESVKPADQQFEVGEFVKHIRLDNTKGIVRKVDRNLVWIYGKECGLQVYLSCNLERVEPQKEEKETEYKSCDNCNHEEKGLLDLPCIHCIRNDGDVDCWEPKEEEF